MSKRLTYWILGAMILGAIVGQLIHDPNWKVGDPAEQHSFASIIAIFSVIGNDIFLAALQMVVVPLVALSVFSGVASVGSSGALGRLGGWAMLYYFATMLMAVTLGIFIVTLMNPGAAFEGVLGGPELPDVVSDAAQGGFIGIFQNLLQQLIPKNIVEALAGGQTLGIIFFSILAGCAALACGESGRRVAKAAEDTFAVVMKVVEMVLNLAPVGVFCLLAWAVARVGLGVFGEGIGHYMVTVIVGLLLHGFVVLPIVLAVFGRINPFWYLNRIKLALLTAFGTDSSVATLPVSLRVASEEGQVDPKVARMVLPLGATINMDGTALFEAVAVIFLAQAVGIELGMVELVIIAFTATLAAVGAAGIPSAGLVTMVIVIQAVNQSLAATGNALIPIAGIGILLAVDRLLDMVRTVVNVWGDLVGAKIISERVRESAR